MRTKGYIAIGMVCLAYWILDSVWSFVSFEYNLKNLIISEPASYIDTLLLRVPPYQVVSRLMVVCLFLVLGGIILEFFIKRQAADKKRREVHETLLTVLNSIDATIYVADMENYEILFMNRYMIDHFGGDSTGKTCHEVFRQNPDICRNCKNDKLLDEAGNPKEVLVWEGQNPITKTWFLNYDRAIKWTDGRMVHLQIATDISQLKELQAKQIEAESKLRQAQKMESIGNLAGGIAHDFNNILSSIIGFTELALDDVQAGSITESNIEEVLAAGNRAKELVKQILTFARQSEVALKPIQVKPIIQDALKLIRSTIPTTISIRQHLESDALIMGNDAQMNQIIMNLCTNAAQAMEDDGGTLEVSLKDIVLDSDQDWRLLKRDKRSCIELKVSDTGTGMPADTIRSIFEPYFTTKSPGEGTGMGLAVVNGIVESYRGKIMVDSALGEGTVFTIRLPTTTYQKSESAQPATSLPTGHERILLVDDEEAIVKMGRQILERLGYTVTALTSSVVALELFLANPDDFDLVITDMTMPDITGDQLAMEIMKIRPAMPIVICTGYSKKISDERAAKLGIKAFEFKPIVKSDLANTVRKVLDEADAAARQHASTIFTEENLRLKPGR